jgi:hypothetical protein
MDYLPFLPFGLHRVEPDSSRVRLRISQMAQDPSSLLTPVSGSANRLTDDTANTFCKRVTGDQMAQDPSALPTPVSGSANRPTDGTANTFCKRVTGDQIQGM